MRRADCVQYPIQRNSVLSLYNLSLKQRQMEVGELFATLEDNYDGIYIICFHLSGEGGILSLRGG